MTRALTNGSERSAIRLYDALSRVWECVGLSVLWVVGCLPVITAGSSTIALFRVVAERRRGEYRPVARAYWLQVRRRPVARAAGTVLTLLALGGVTTTFVAGMTARDAGIATALQASALIGAAAVLGALVTALPLKGERDTGLLDTLRLAAGVGLARPLTTVAAVVLTVAVGVAAVLAPPVLVIAGWVWARLLLELSRSALARLPIAPATRGQET